MAEQRQAFGEGLVVRGPSEIEKQKVFEAERHERTEKSRREKEAALQKAKEDEVSSLDLSSMINHPIGS